MVFKSKPIPSAEQALPGRAADSFVDEHNLKGPCPALAETVYFGLCAGVAA